MGPFISHLPYRYHKTEPVSFCSMLRTAQDPRCNENKFLAKPYLCQPVSLVIVSTRGFLGIASAASPSLEVLVRI